MNVEDRCFYAFYEPQRRQYYRIAGVALVTAIAFGGVGLSLGVEWPIALVWWPIALGGTWRYFGLRYCLAIRQHDFFTSFGGAREPIHWRHVESLEATNHHLLIKNKGRDEIIKVAIGPFDLADRWQLIYVIRIYFEIFEKEGALILPGSSDLKMKTDRLIIRPIRTEDRDTMIRLQSEPSGFATQLNDPLPEDLVKQSFPSEVDSHRTHPLRWKLGLFEKEGGEMIGYLSIWADDCLMRTADMGIGLAKAHRGKGFGTEAVKAIIGFLDRETNLHRLSAGCFAHNYACQRALEKSGMNRFSEIEKFWFRHGDWVAGYGYDYHFDRTESADSDSQVTPP